MATYADNYENYTRGPVYNYSWGERCHSGTLEVFTDPESKIKICAGGERRDVSVTKEQLFLDVGCDSPFNMSVTGVIGSTRLEALASGPVIRLKWPDFGVPYLGKGFWLELINVLRINKKDVVIACWGGHGRTGTALAILAKLMGACEGNPVEFVREKYCSNAIETQVQIKYVAHMIGIELDDEPSKEYRYKKKETTAISDSMETNDLEELPGGNGLMRCSGCGIYTSDRSHDCGNKYTHIKYDDASQEWISDEEEFKQGKMVTDESIKSCDLCAEDRADIDYYETEFGVFCERCIVYYEE